MSIIRRLLGLERPSASRKASSPGESLLDKLDEHKKTAWIPEVVDGDGAPSDSKYSGLAFIPVDQEWPNCGNCGQPMQLFVQINSEHLPDEAREYLEAGILQLFYCTNWDEECEVKCEAFFPFSKASLVRIIEPGDSNDLVTSPVKDSFPPKRIIGWHSVTDYPDWEELKRMGAEVQLNNEEHEQVLESHEPKIGEKLGGWPAWVQGVEYPQCPECQEQMQHVFQVDSNQNIPYMFGDVGCGHITQCRNHPHVLAFGWACC